MSNIEQLTKDTAELTVLINNVTTAYFVRCFLEKSDFRGKLTLVFERRCVVDGKWHQYEERENAEMRACKEILRSFDQSFFCIEGLPIPVGTNSVCGKVLYVIRLLIIRSKFKTALKSAYLLDKVAKAKIIFCGNGLSRFFLTGLAPRAVVVRFDHGLGDYLDYLRSHNNVVIRVFLSSLRCFGLDLTGDTLCRYHSIVPRAPLLKLARERKMIQKKSTQFSDESGRRSNQRCSSISPKGRKALVLMDTIFGFTQLQLDHEHFFENFVEYLTRVLSDDYVWCVKFKNYHVEFQDIFFRCLIAAKVNYSLMDERLPAEILLEDHNFSIVVGNLSSVLVYGSFRGVPSYSYHNWFDRYCKDHFGRSFDELSDLGFLNESLGSPVECLE